MYCRYCCRSFSLGGEIESRLAYTQKSEGQNLPGRPLPRCIIRSAPVYDIGGSGAKPGEAANFRSRIGTNKEPTPQREKRYSCGQTIYEQHPEQVDCAG